MTQIGLAFFGLLALWMAMSDAALPRRWAPLVGLAGQPFWLAFAIEARSAGVNSDGLFLTVGCFTIVYLRGAWLQWRDKIRGIGQPGSNP